MAVLLGYGSTYDLRSDDRIEILDLTLDRKRQRVAAVAASPPVVGKDGEVGSKDCRQRARPSTGRPLRRPRR